MLRGCLLSLSPHLPVLAVRPGGQAALEGLLGKQSLGFSMLTSLPCPQCCLSQRG